jgi:hypothetical protein
MRIVFLPRPAGLLIALVAFPAAAARGQFPAETTLDPARFAGPGVLYVPIAETRGAGGSLAAAGNVNHAEDRFPDLLIGAPGTGAAPGSAFLVLRTGRSPMPLPAPPPEHGGAVAVHIRSGLSGPDRFGAAVAGAGDVDGDLHDDLLITLPGTTPELPAGGVFLLFGRSQLPALVNLARVPAVVEHLVLETELGGDSGEITVAGAGDLNGDGLADLVLGFPDGRSGDPGGEAIGRAYVVFGSAALRAAAGTSLDLEALSPEVGFSVLGPAPGSRLGASVAGLGDLDGDGIDDLALGAPGHGAGGTVFVLFGGEGLSAPDLALPDGTLVVALEASGLPGARFGAALAGGRDADGDGRPDLLAGAPRAPGRDGPDGAAVLVRGGPALRGEGPAVPVPGPGVTLLMGPRGSSAGSSVALVPDLSGDGIAEILAGAPERRGTLGAAYVVPGAAGLPPTLVLEEAGAAFLSPLEGSRLGSTVLGIEDRSGDGRGDIVLGAPGTAFGPASGAVFELFLPVAPGSAAPRQLRAHTVPGARVLLTWSLAGRYDLLRVFRDGVPIALLPGYYQHFVDVAPGTAPHVYVVEADGDPALRSNPAAIRPDPLPVEIIECRQLPGDLVVRLRWIPLDTYEALEVLVDGRPASGRLDPHQREIDLAVPAGERLIEIRDPLRLDGLRASCRLRIIEPLLPPIADLQCELAAARAVRLTWTPPAAYEEHVILRNGVRVAVIGPAGEYLDAESPAGVLDYQVRGLQSRLHLGPAASCRVVAGGADLPRVSGRVAFAGGEGPHLRRGAVRIFAASGAPVAGSQVGDDGVFSAPVPAPGAYRLVFQVPIEGAPSLGLDGRVLTVTVDAVRAADAADPAREVTVEVPLPIFLVASERAGGRNETALERWDPLLAAAGERALLFPLGLPVGLSRGALSLGRQIDAHLEHLRAELGGAPARFDITAFGAAGLAARAFLSASPGRSVRKLVLLGTPNLGTERGEVESRGELIGRPPRPLGPDGDLRAAGEPGEAVERTAVSAGFFAAAEQTPEFLAAFNDLHRATRGAEAHLVAGLGGRAALDAVLGCARHDGRVCEESAHGGIPGAVLHTLSEDHEDLGRGAASRRLLLETIHGILAPGTLGALGAPEDAGGAGDPGAHGGGAGAEGPEAGGGGGAESSYAPSGFYSGVLEPGGGGELLMISDTSESIIIILNSELPGGIEFRVREPGGGEVIDPPGAGARADVSYLTLGDGEGHEIQLYEFLPAREGEYTVLLDNLSDNAAIAYTLEAYLPSDFTLEAALTPAEVVVGAEALLTARVLAQGAPAAAVVEAAVSRPDGGIELVALVDDGSGPDAAAGDGTHSAVLSSALAGLHSVALSARSAAGTVPSFRRERALQLRVQSEAARLAGAYSSGVTDGDGDGLLEALWIEGVVEADEPGTFLVFGALTSAEGAPVSTGTALFSVLEPGAAAYRLVFDGAEIRAAGADGPYVLAEARLFDGTVGFVLADEERDAHVTEPYAWEEFAVAAGEPYVRGDVNADGEIDLSDPVSVLNFLFLGGARPPCEDAADTDGDGDVNITDASFFLNFLFLGGPAPPAPFPACGVAPAAGCASYPPCG